MKNVVLGVAVLFVFSSSICQGEVEIEEATENVSAVIEYLIKYVSESDLQFVRNGELRSAEEAAKHIRKKYNYYTAKISTPEEFIELSASKSMLSGRPYLVRFSDASTKKVSDWLLEELVRYRRKGAKWGGSAEVETESR